MLHPLTGAFYRGTVGVDWFHRHAHQHTSGVLKALLVLFCFRVRHLFKRSSARPWTSWLPPLVRLTSTGSAWRGMEMLPWKAHKQELCLSRRMDVIIPFFFQVQSDCEIQDGLLLFLPSSGFCNVPCECVWTAHALNKDTDLVGIALKSGVGVKPSQSISRNLQTFIICRQGLTVRRNTAMPNTSCWRWESSFKYR